MASQYNQSAYNRPSAAFSGLAAPPNDFASNNATKTAPSLTSNDSIAALGTTTGRAAFTGGNVEANSPHRTTDRNVFRFMELPAELRNRIYEYYLPTTVRSMAEPKLLVVSQTIRHEARLMFYANAYFAIATKPVHLPGHTIRSFPWASWLSRLELPIRKVLKNVDIVQDWSYPNPLSTFWAKADEQINWTEIADLFIDHIQALGIDAAAVRVFDQEDPLLFTGQVGVLDLRRIYNLLDPFWKSIEWHGYRAYFPANEEGDHDRSTVGARGKWEEGALE